MTAGRTTFIDAVADGFRGWRDFSGRATRPQFWYWTLFTVLVNMVLSTLDVAIFPRSSLTIDVSANSFSQADFTAFLDEMVRQFEFSVASWAEYLLLLPTVAVTARRFRDAGLPGVLGAFTRIVPYVSTPVILAIAYSVAGEMDNSAAPEVGIVTAIISFLFFGLVSLGALILTLVGGLRPTRAPTGS